MVGYRLQVERNQGFLIDDTGLNGIQLECEGGHDTEKIQGPYGRWLDWLTCRKNSHVTAFDLRSVQDRKILDDYGAVNVDMKCSNGVELLGNGLNRGRWSGFKKCPSNTYFCGVKAKIEYTAIVDHTGLNQMSFLCCKVEGNKNEY